ncbi:hypothetical protein Neosp_013840 [[Neocosmospora] mangrovei]
MGCGLSKNERPVEANYVGTELIRMAPPTRTFWRDQTLESLKHHNSKADAMQIRKSIWEGIATVGPQSALSHT